MRQQRKNMLQEKLHLKYCYEAVLKQAEVLLQRHGITSATYSKNTSTAASKPYSRQESQQDLVLGADMPISSIQATIAKLSIRTTQASLNQSHRHATPTRRWGLEEPASGGRPPLASPTGSPAKIHSPPPNGTDNTSLPLSPSPPVTTTAAAVVVEEDPPSSPPPTEASPPPPPAPAPSSLELLASLAPEAFSMEGGGRGKQRVTKQSFLQPTEGQGLQGARERGADDPLSSLDPLWTLNKS
ncbi:hypothetical protein CRUP_012335 [Coryphaenoides rupestris]|nr:hypothetical protein CRUP_012335 [Coryphaenoides rupestris]